MASITDTTSPNYPYNDRTLAPDLTTLPPLKPVILDTPTPSIHSTSLNPELLAMSQPQTRIFLKPLANPSCLGMAAFFGGTWVFSTLLTGWYHQDDLQTLIIPFMLVFGGLAQFITGFYAFPARDNLATVFHVSWGSFYLSYGLLYAVQLVGDTTALPGLYDYQSSTATWVVVMAALTWVMFFASIGRDVLVTAITFLQAVGATLMFGGWYSHGSSDRRSVKAGGYFMMVASVLALCQVFLLLVQETAGSEGAWWGRLYSWQQNLPWVRARYGVRIPISEPGIRKAQ